MKTQSKLRMVGGRFDASNIQQVWHTMCIEKTRVSFTSAGRIGLNTLVRYDRTTIALYLNCDNHF